MFGYELVFIVIDKKAPKQERLLSILDSEDAEHKLELLEYCQQVAQNYYLQDSSWKYFSSIVKGDVIRYELDNINALNFILNAS